VINALVSHGAPGPVCGTDSLYCKPVLVDSMVNTPGSLIPHEYSTKFGFVPNHVYWNQEKLSNEKTGDKYSCETVPFSAFSVKLFVGEGGG
jgi:hypothetical protein